MSYNDSWRPLHSLSSQGVQHARRPSARLLARSTAW